MTRNVNAPPVRRCEAALVKVGAPETWSRRTRPRSSPRHLQESVDELHHEGVADARRRRGGLLAHGDAREALHVVEQVQAAGGDQGAVHGSELARVDRVGRGAEDGGLTVHAAAGSLYLLHNVQDLARIPLRKKAAAPPPRISDALVLQFVDRLLAVARR